MSNYPERPLRHGRPKSSHSGSKKGRTWFQQPGVIEKQERQANLSIDLNLSFLGHSGVRRRYHDVI